MHLISIVLGFNILMLLLWVLFGRHLRAHDHKYPTSTSPQSEEAQKDEPPV